MRTIVAVLILSPMIAFSQYSARMSYSQGAPTYRWIYSSESVDFSFMYSTSEQWRFGLTMAWQYLMLNSTGNQGIMTPVSITCRYYTAEAGLRGYFEGQAGIVRRYYQYLIYSKFSPSDEFTLVGWDSNIHLAPLYGVGFGIAIPMAPTLELNVGMQIDVSPKGFRRSNIDSNMLDGFSQTRALIGIDYKL